MLNSLSAASAGIMLLISSLLEHHIFCLRFVTGWSCRLTAFKLMIMALNGREELEIHKRHQMTISTLFSVYRPYHFRLSHMAGCIKNSTVRWLVLAVTGDFSIFDTGACSYMCFSSICGELMIEPKHGAWVDSEDGVGAPTFVQKQDCEHSSHAWHFTRRGRTELQP